MSGSQQPVASVEELPAGSSKLVMIDGREVALISAEDGVYAIGNRCPHRSGPLVKGKVERVVEDSSDPAKTTLVVRCPIHGWLFELSTGRCLTRPTAAIQTYPVDCDSGQICVGPAQGQAAGPGASSVVS